MAGLDLHKTEQVTLDLPSCMMDFIRRMEPLLKMTAKQYLELAAMEAFTAAFGSEENPHSKSQKHGSFALHPSHG